MLRVAFVMLIHIPSSQEYELGLAAAYQPTPDRHMTGSSQEGDGVRTRNTG